VKFTTRLAILLGAFTVLFSMLGIRLWFLQIAEGAEAAEVTASQDWVVVPTPAPRGDIRDRNGVLLATSSFEPAVVVDRHLVKPEQRDDLVQRLSAILAIPPADLDALYEEAGVNGRFTVAVIDATLAYQLSEQVRDLPGVRIEKQPVRVYLSGASMAHVVGHLGLPDEDDIAADPTLDPTTRIGKLGVERIYEEYLRGIPGEEAFRVDQSEVVELRPDAPAQQGDTVYLTLDLELQEVVEQALAEGLVSANRLKADQRRRGGGDEAKNDAVRAAAVVLDVRSGAVLAMASVPTFNPSGFVTGMDPETFTRLNEQQAFLNLAVTGLYPPASTFKVVTYMAELEENIPFPTEINDQPVEGVDPEARIVDCDGELRLPGLGEGQQQVFKDWYYGSGFQFGWLDEHGALENSCNIYFYTVALGAWSSWAGTDRENVIQDQARELGFGEASRIDLTGEAVGSIPDRALFEEYKELMLEDPDAPALLDQFRLEAASPWFGGDLMNVAIGQGGVTSTPLQVANAYAALANGGTLFRPFVVSQIRDGDQTVVYESSVEAIRELDFDPDHIDSLLDDLNAVVTSGTASAAFAGFGATLDQVGGKTGTGQAGETRDNHAWFAGVAPIDNPRYAIAVVVDEGGSGGAVAAPIGRYILQYLMGEELDPITAGQFTD
jgi:penicillin-binding protein 2